MEIEALVGLYADTSSKLQKSIDRLHTANPIHKHVMGAIQTPATALTIALVEATQRPAAGRLWNILSVSVFASDSHTPVASTVFQSSGTAAAPGANANISGATSVVTPGSYIFNWTVGLSGTVAAPADTNNFKLVLTPTGIIPNSANPAAVGQYPQTPFPFVVTTANSGTLHVNSVGAATAGSQYNASVLAVPQVGPGQLPQTFADIYGGSFVSDNPATQQPFTDVIVPAASIPSVNFIPSKAVWLHELEALYAVIYNPPANSQFVVAARVAEYPVEAIETLGV